MRKRQRSLSGEKGRIRKTFLILQHFGSEVMTTTLLLVVH